MTVVVAAIIERDGKILICRRRADHAHPLKWEFPGGKVEPGESPADALRRELAEELAIAAQIGKEITRYEYTYPGKQPILLIFYSVSAFDGEPINQIFAEITWDAAANLPHYDFLEGDTDFIRIISGTNY